MLGIIGSKSSGVLGQPLPKPFGNVACSFPVAFTPTAALVISVSADEELMLTEFFSGLWLLPRKDPEQTVDTSCCQHIKSTLAKKSLSNLSLYHPNESEMS